MCYRFLQAHPYTPARWVVPPGHDTSSPYNHHTSPPCSLTAQAVRGFSRSAGWGLSKIFWRLWFLSFTHLIETLWCCGGWSGKGWGWLSDGALQGVPFPGMLLSLYNNIWHVCWQMQSPRLEGETRIAIGKPRRLYMRTTLDVKIGLQVLLVPSCLKQSFLHQPNKLQQPAKIRTQQLTNKISRLPCSSCM